MLHKYLLLLLINHALSAKLEPAASALSILRTPSGGRRSLDGSYEFHTTTEITDSHGGTIFREDQYYQGIRVDGVHVTEHIVDGEAVDTTGFVVTHIEDDLPSVADVPLADMDQLMAPYECEEVKYEEVIEFHDGNAILAYKVDCWTAFDAEIDGIHRWRMEFDASTGQLLSKVDAIDHHLPKTAADRMKIDTDHSSSVANLHERRTRRNLALETMTGYGGNERTGQLTHSSLKIQRDGDTCTYSSDNVNVVHNEFTESRYMTTPFSFPCSDLPEQTDAINGAFSPLNDASAYGEVVYEMFQDWYDMEALPFKLSMRVHYGNNWENAMWDGSAMYFGDGQSYFHPLVSLGVTAHEVSHGVTEYAADLIYSEQSGGLNEAFSDMSAAAAEFYYWGETNYEMGSKIAKNSGAMRYMCDPTRDGRSIDHVNDFHSDMDVHHSSGVFNKVFCELSKLDNWGPRKTFNLFLTANKAYWEKDTDFQEAADLTMSAAVALEYESEDICGAFAIVGLIAQGCDGTIPTDPPLECNDGSALTTLELHTAEWGQEITWDVQGTDCSSDRTYGDERVYQKECCLPYGDHVLNCLDSYGDGWHGAFVVIGGVEYCRQFESGTQQTAAFSIGQGPTDSPVTPSPTDSPTTRSPSFSPVTSSPSMPPVGSPTEACTQFDVQLNTADWAVEISWEIEGTTCASGMSYSSHDEYTKTCCIPAGDYVLNCRDSYGDGWHGAFIVIGGVEYCRSFENGYVMTDSVSIDGQTPSQPPVSTPGPTRSPVSTPSPSSSPVTSHPTNLPTHSPIDPCRMQTVKLFTLFWAHEIEWDLLNVAGCSSHELGHMYENDSVYEFECCIPDFAVTLKCMNSMGDGWHHGYLEIEGNKFCGDPFGFEEMVEISFPLEQPTGCRDNAPTHVCEKIMGRGWCDHVQANDICAQTCNQCEM